MRGGWVVAGYVYGTVGWVRVGGRLGWGRIVRLVEVG